MTPEEADALWSAGGCSLRVCTNCGGYMPDSQSGPTHPSHPRAPGKFTCDEIEIRR